MQEFHISNIEKEWMDIVEEFPEFLKDPSPFVLECYNNQFPINEFVNLRYGFECNYGWKNLIRNYFQKIKSLIEKAKENNHEVFYKTFILKEKFGELRDQGDFYGPDAKLYYNEYSDLCHNVCVDSSQVCEICGSNGKLSRKNSGFGWFKSLCESHRDDMNYH